MSKSSTRAQRIWRVCRSRRGFATYSLVQHSADSRRRGAQQPGRLNAPSGTAELPNFTVTRGYPRHVRLGQHVASNGSPRLSASTARRGRASKRPPCLTTRSRSDGARSGRSGRPKGNGQEVGGGPGSGPFTSWHCLSAKRSRSFSEKTKRPCSLARQSERNNWGYQGSLARFRAEPLDRTCARSPTTQKLRGPFGFC